MSALFNVAGERLTRTTNLVAASSDYTAMAWVRINSLPSVLSSKVPWTRLDAARTSGSGIYCDTDGGNGFGLLVGNGSGLISIVDGESYTVGVWFHFAYTKSGNTHTLYVNGDLKGSVSVDFSAVTLSDMYCGGDDGVTTESDLNVAYFREWSDNLTLSEVVDEMNSTVPLEQVGDLVTDTPLASDGNDDSGNGNDWTTVGSVTFAAQPPFLANSTAATATTIASLPYAASLDMNPGGTIAFDAWYTITPATTGVLGIWGFGNLTDYAPLVSVWSPDAVTSYLGVGAENVPIQIPVTASTVYYLRFRPVQEGSAGRESDPAHITISVIEAPTQTVPIGSIAVNDDTDGHPLAVLSSVDGDNYNVLRFFNGFPAGEGGDVLNDGSVCVYDMGASGIKFFDASYTEVAAVAFDGHVIRTCRDAQHVYVAQETSPGVTTPVRVYNGAGVEQDTHSLTNIGNRGAIAASNDETILYHIEEGNNSALERWDLVGNAPLSDLAAGVANYQTADILVLSDDTIVATYVKTSTTVDVQVRRYNAAGTLLNTYNFGSDQTFPSGTLPRLAYSLLDPASFWIWTHPASTPFVSKFLEVRVSDGATLRTVLGQEYEGGAYFADPTATPERFGNSFSCPFWVATTAFPASGASIIVEKVTVPSLDTTEFDFTATGLTPTSFTLTHGEQQLYNPVTPGSGYSIVETASPLFSTSYSVSNDSPHTNITVSADEQVTVTVTNTRLDQFTVSTETRPIRRLRQTPHVSANGNRLFHNRLQLDMRVGVGLPSGQGSDPKVTLQVSRDGGMTWGVERFASAGAIGQYLTRVQFYRQGVGRDVVYRIVVSDPVAWQIVGAYLELEEGLN